MRPYVDINKVIMSPRRDALTVIGRALVLWAIYADCQNGCTGYVQ